jgi:hypothetical protein
MGLKMGSKATSSSAHPARHLSLIRPNSLAIHHQLWPGSGEEFWNHALADRGGQN